jgi:UDP-glucuronate 4-epimerase
MQTVVTGVAGFIGSTLAAELLRRGDHVIGIDRFEPADAVATKRRNLEPLLAESRFRFVELDLATQDFDPWLAGADAVYHLAAIAGVRHSWSDPFSRYLTANVLVTQRVLESAVRCRTPRVVYASSSSVYGNAVRYPCQEGDLPAPYSPYGVTKLAGEHLCRAYAANHGLGVVVLRYFTVYGPRQRTDMAINIAIDSALRGEKFRVHSPDALRDFTYVDDIVRATALAGSVPGLPSDTVINVASGAVTPLGDVLNILGDLLGVDLLRQTGEPQPGDVTVTSGDISRARALLGWEPQVDLSEGLARQVRWQAGLTTATPPTG